MRTLIHVALTGLVALSLGAVAQEGSPPAGEADEVMVVGQEAESEEPVPEAAVPLVIPAKERDRKNPLPDDPEVAARGERLFASQCTMCHGAAGDGRGELVERLGLTVPDFSTADARSRRTDGELFYILGKGHGSMVAQEKRLTADERWSIVRYIRTLAP